MRALWNQTLDDPATRHVLFTGESAVLEAIYISGPVLIVAGIGGLISIPAAALACGVFGLLGTLMFAATARLARVAARARPRGWARRRARLPRRAHAAGDDDRGRRRRRHDRGRRARAVRGAPAGPSATGFVLGLWGFGSLVGGVVASRLAAAEDPGGG